MKGNKFRLTLLFHSVHLGFLLKGFESGFHVGDRCFIFEGLITTIGLLQLLSTSQANSNRQNKQEGLHDGISQSVKLHACAALLRGFISTTNSQLIILGCLVSIMTSHIQSSELCPLEIMTL